MSIGKNPIFTDVTHKGYADFATADGSPKRAGRKVYVRDEHAWYNDDGATLTPEQESVAIELVINKNTGIQYTSLQDAINALADGETLDIASGNHTAMQMDFSALTLNNIVINGQGSTPDKNTVVGRVTLGSNLTNVTFTDIDIYEASQSALEISGASGVVFFNCVIDTGATNVARINDGAYSGILPIFNECRFPNGNLVNQVNDPTKFIELNYCSEVYLYRNQGSAGAAAKFSNFTASVEHAAGILFLDQCRLPFLDSVASNAATNFLIVNKCNGIDFAASNITVNIPNCAYKLYATSYDAAASTVTGIDLSDIYDNSFAYRLFGKSLANLDAYKTHEGLISYATDIQRIVVADGTDLKQVAYIDDLGSKQDNIITTKGDLIVGDTAGAAIRKPVGNDNEVLMVDSTEPDGLKFAAIPSAPVNSVNTKTGDVVLDADDIDDTATAHKFATQAELDQIATNETDIAAINTSIGQPNGIAPLDGSGLVPAANLPSYVDDIIEVADFASLPVTGESGKIYITIDNNKQYRWSGSAYVEINPAVSNVEAYADLASFPVTGQTDVIYVAEDTNIIYRWNGSAYVELAASGGGVEQYADLASFPVAGDITIFYIALDTGFGYYYDGSAYVREGVVNFDELEDVAILTGDDTDFLAGDGTFKKVVGTTNNYVGAGQIGEVITMAAETPPTNFLLCDGSEVAKATYSDLYGIIGDSWGTASDPNNFLLPDLMGQFLRGYSLDNTVDLEGPRSVGSYQSDDNKAHSHTIQGTTNVATNGSNIASSSTTQVYANKATSSDGTESRPKNAAVGYFIRYDNFSNDIINEYHLNIDAQLDLLQVKTMHLVG